MTATGVLLGIVLPTYLVGSLAVSIREDFPVSGVELGLAGGGSLATAALTAPFAGRLVARVGVERAIQFAGSLVLASTLVIATTAESASALIGVMAVMGVGGGIGSPSIVGLIARDVREARQGTALGILTSAPQLAAFAAGLALPLIAEPLSWRAAFACAGVVTAVSAYSVPRRPPLAKPRSPRPVGPSSTNQPLVALAALAAALASASGIGSRFFLVVFAIGSGFSPSDSGLLLAGTGVVAIASRLASGVLADRKPSKALGHASTLMAVSAVGFALMALEFHPAIILGAFLAGGIGWGWPAALDIAVVRANTEAPTQAIGIQMTGFMGGGAVGPLLVGGLVQYASFEVAWLVCCVLSTLAAAIVVLAGRRGHG